MQLPHNSIVRLMSRSFSKFHEKMQNSTFNTKISAVFVLNELRNALLAVALAAIMDYRAVLCVAL